MKNLHIIALCCILSGCASAGMNAMCGHINGTNLTYPGYSGKGDVNAYACHMGCIGNCPKPDYAALAKLTSDYANAQTGSLASVPATITITPAK